MYEYLKTYRKLLFKMYEHKTNNYKKNNEI